MSPTTSFYLPNTLRNWPYPRLNNPFYHRCNSETTQWCESFNALPSEKRKEKFRTCQFGLLGSRMFATQSYAMCRLGCDLINFGFMFDVFLDAGNMQSARRQADEIMCALRNPALPSMSTKSEWVGARMARSFATSAIPLIFETTNSLMAWHLFLDAFQKYTDAVVERQQDKMDHRIIESVEEYVLLRRETIAMRTVFALYLATLNILCDEDIFNGPEVAELEECCLDMITISNDLCSYNVEQARGDSVHNMVTIAMHQFDIGLEAAIAWVGELNDSRVERFISISQSLRSTQDTNISRYIDMLGNCVRAHDEWCFETEKYFGKYGREVQSTRRVELLPQTTSIDRSLCPSSNNDLPLLPKRQRDMRIYRPIGAVHNARAHV